MAVARGQVARGDAVEGDPDGLLDRLPRDEAAILRARFHSGLSQAEIAERSGVPLGTVKMRMVQGLARLRDLIEAEEGGA